MRNLTVAFVFILFFSSCSEVRFAEPQPVDVKSLDHFPKRLIGNYIGSSGDTLCVQREQFCYEGDDVKQLSSDRVFLKKKGRLYFLSCKEILVADEISERKGWEVMPFELTDDTLMVYFLDTADKRCREATLSQLKSIIHVTEEYQPDGKVEYYYIAPNKKQFNQILDANLFSVADKFVRID